MVIRKGLVTVAAALILSVAALTLSLAQGMMGGSDMMRGRCPMCGGPWQSPGAWDGSIPDKLPKPKNDQWISRLRTILTLEKLSKAQYTADEDKYRIMMPYVMIIPQETNHIDWIGRLFAAYGLKSDGKTPSVKKSESVTQAYEIGRNLEVGLIPKYVWLIKNAEDKTTKQVLDTILVQTRIHHMLFTHALDMGGMGMWR